MAMYVAAGASLIAGWVVMFKVPARSVRAGDDWLTEQAKAGCWSGLTMVSLMAAFLALANLVNWLSG
jgi:hypothetical protein